MQAPQIAIIGGGIAGLTAAWHLKSRGMNPMVCEAEDQPGGRARSTHAGGAVQDLGAWTFTTDSPIHRLAKELQMSSQIIRIPASLGRPVRGQLKTGSLGKPTSLVGSVFRTRQLFDLLRLQRMAEKLPGSTPDMSAADWARGHFASSFVNDVLEPIAGLYFLQELRTLSRDYLLNTLNYLATVKLSSFKHGMGQLAATLAKQLPVFTRLKIEDIEARSDGILIQGHGFSKTVSGVLLATPLPETLRLLSPFLAAPIANRMSQWRYAATVITHFLLDIRMPRAALQVLPPFGNRGVACGLTMERVKHPARSPRGMETVAMYARADQVAALERMSDQQALDEFAMELSRWLPATRGHIQPQRITRWKHAAAFCDPGVPEKVAALEAGLADLRRQRPIFVAGDFFGTSGLDGAVKSAETAAEQCLHHFFR